MYIFLHLCIVRNRTQVCLVPLLKGSLKSCNCTHCFIKCKIKELEDTPNFSLIVSVRGTEQTAPEFITSFSLLARKERKKVLVFTKDMYLPL